MALEIDDRYIDVDFTREPNFGRGNQGIGRALATGRTFEGAYPLLPENQWQLEIEAIDAQEQWLESLLVAIRNQKQEGSCVSNATATAHEVSQAVQHGLENVVQLSAISLYKRVARSAGSGSYLSDNLDEITERGVLPLDTPANRARFSHVMPATGFSQKLPDGWETTAAELTAVEALPITSVAGLVTAVVRRFGVVVGRDGHSIYYCRPRRHQGRIAFVYANSWSEQWGFAAGKFSGGFGLDTLSAVQRSAQWAFALRAVRRPPITTIQPKRNP